MLTFAAPLKGHLILGSHRAATSTPGPVMDKGGGGGETSRAKRLSWIMHPSSSSQSSATAALPPSLSPPPHKESVQESVTAAPTRINVGLPQTTEAETTIMGACSISSVNPDLSTTVNTAASDNSPASDLGAIVTNEDAGPAADADNFAASTSTASLASVPASKYCFNASESVSPSDTRKWCISFPDELPKPDHPPSIQTPIDALSESSSGRKSSVSSVSFRRSRNPSIAPSLSRRISSGVRIRAASPPPQRFQKHVGFDNVPNGEATKNNTLSLTLNVRHKGYQARRRSRSFMVGVDEHSYSDYAIQWLLDELVDDGDEVVCVRVIEKEIRYPDTQYQDDAQSVMQNILAKNCANRAISFVLEYAVGKLHATFQKLIQMYQPAMLIVGTRGRSLGGIQGLVNSRNSFSKYCLQYSPVPVVVVRPTEKRIKKKVKRAKDSTRQTYLSMLAANNGLHEADSETSSTYELEPQNSPDEEAHQVAKVLGLPAAFDPTIKPTQDSSITRSRPSSPNPAANGRLERLLNRSPGSAGGDTEEEEDEEEGEFDVADGRDALNQQEKLEQLHEMEVGEAAALKMKAGHDEEESDEPPFTKGAS